MDSALVRCLTRSGTPILKRKRSSEDLIDSIDLINDSQSPSQEEEESEHCNWTGRFSQLEKHISVCLFSPIVCPFDECCALIQRRALDLHISSCPHRILCELCGQTVIPQARAGEHRLVCSKRLVACEHPDCRDLIAYDELPTHLLNDCEHRQIACPKLCGMNISASSLAFHFATVCGHENVSCGFASFGCSELVRRKDLDLHMRDDTQHFSPSLVTGLLNRVHLLERDLEAVAAKLKEQQQKAFDTHLWTVPSFDITKMRYDSPPFTIQGLQCSLVIVISSAELDNKPYIDLYICVNSKLKGTVSLSFALLKCLEMDRASRKSCVLEIKKEKSHIGYAQFISIERLLREGFIRTEDKSLTVAVQLSVAYS